MIGSWLTKFVKQIVDLSWQWNIKLAPVHVIIMLRVSPKRDFMVAPDLSTVYTWKWGTTPGLNFQVPSSPFFDIAQLTEAVFSCDVIPSDWEESFFLNLYKGKGEALDRGNYRCLKLTEQVMKLLEWV